MGRVPVFAPRGLAKKEQEIKQDTYNLYWECAGGKL